MRERERETETETERQKSSGIWFLIFEAISGLTDLQLFKVSICQIHGKQKLKNFKEKNGKHMR